MLDRLKIDPPSNLEAEMALIGAALVSNDVLRIVDGLIEPADFFDELHAHVWRSMVAMHADGQAVTPITLRPMVADCSPVNDQPAWKYLGKLMINATTIINAPSYAKTIREAAARRMLWVAGEDIIANACNASLSVSETASQAVSALDHVLSSTRAGQRKITSAGQAFIDVMQDAQNGVSGDRITTGYAHIDAALGGWWRRQIAIVAGRPSMGKSTFAVSSIVKAAKAGHGCMLFSLEMPTKQVAARIMTDLSYTQPRALAYADILSGQCKQGDLDLLARTAIDYEALPLHIDDQRGLSVAEIAARVRAQAQRMERDGQRLELVVVDHLGLLKPSGRYAGNRVQEVAEISDGLATLAKDMDVAVVALHQLNRGVEGRENKRPGLADLRDSGSIEQDADAVCFTYREAYYLERVRFDAGSEQEMRRQAELDAVHNCMELMIAKNRNGPTTSINLFVDMKANAVRGLAS